MDYAPGWKTCMMRVPSMSAMSNVFVIVLQQQVNACFPTWMPPMLIFNDVNYDQLFKYPFTLYNLFTIVILTYGNDC